MNNGFCISDSHNDFLTVIKDKKCREKYIQECIGNGVKNLACAVFTYDLKLTINDIMEYKKEIDLLNQKYDINLLLTIEDLGFIRTQSDIEKLIELKPFSVTLTWNYYNQFGGGANTNGRLTTLGKNIIRQLESSNIVIDTAHLSREAFFEFIKVTDKPIFNSHSNIFSILNHDRNLTDSQIKMIKDSGGYLGITLYDQFISNSRVSCKNIAEQFDYLLNKFGDDFFGFGTDFYGVEFSHLPIDIKDYHELYKVSKNLKTYCLSDEVLNKIFSYNFVNFINKNYI